VNWLAHVYLSEPALEVRLGNLLADLVKGRDRDPMPADFQRGIRQHQAVDSFTDGHPLVHRSRARIASPHRHVTGILVDVFYDHFLALDWNHFSSEPLTGFTQRLYADILAHPVPLPFDAQFILERIIESDRLTSYATRAGIEETLRRISQRLTQRLGRDLALEQAMTELDAHFTALQSDFRAFFPQLQEHMHRWSDAV
jgi:acyl carrier protein phosphodiesterase